MITVNLYYKGTDGNARAFAEEKESSGIAEAQGKRLACIRLYGFFHKSNNWHEPLDV